MKDDESTIHDVALEARGAGKMIVMKRARFFLPVEYSPGLGDRRYWCTKCITDSIGNPDGYLRIESALEPEARWGCHRTPSGAPGALPPRLQVPKDSCRSSGPNQNQRLQTFTAAIDVLHFWINRALVQVHPTGSALARVRENPAGTGTEVRTFGSRIQA